SPLLYILFVTDPYTPPIYTLSLHDALPICNKHHGYVAVRARAVFHDFAFGKPDKVARAERALMRDQGPLQHIHAVAARVGMRRRSEEHTSELQSRVDLVCRLLLEKKNSITT